MTELLSKLKQVKLYTLSIFLFLNLLFKLTSVMKSECTNLLVLGYVCFMPDSLISRITKLRF